MGSQRLTLGMRQAVVELIKAGKTYKEIAEQLGISKGTISKTMQRYEELGTYENRYASGRPRMTTASDERNLIRTVRKNRTLSSSALSTTWYLTNGQKASPRTVRRRLQAANYQWKAAIQKPRLTKLHKKSA